MKQKRSSDSSDSTPDPYVLDTATLDATHRLIESKKRQIADLTKELEDLIENQAARFDELVNLYRRSPTVTHTSASPRTSRYGKKKRATPVTVTTSDTLTTPDSKKAKKSLNYDSKKTKKRTNNASKKAKKSINYDTDSPSEEKEGWRVKKRLKCPGQPFTPLKLKDIKIYDRVFISELTRNTSHYGYITKLKDNSQRVRVDINTDCGITIDRGYKSIDRVRINNEKVPLLDRSHQDYQAITQVLKSRIPLDRENDRKASDKEQEEEALQQKKNDPSTAKLSPPEPRDGNNKRPSRRTRSSSRSQDSKSVPRELRDHNPGPRASKEINNTPTSPDHSIISDDEHFTASAIRRSINRKERNIERSQAFIKKYEQSLKTRDKLQDPLEETRYHKRADKETTRIQALRQSIYQQHLQLKKRFTKSTEDPPIPTTIEHTHEGVVETHHTAERVTEITVPTLEVDSTPLSDSDKTEELGPESDLQRHLDKLQKICLPRRETSLKNLVEQNSNKSVAHFDARHKGAIQDVNEAKEKIENLTRQLRELRGTHEKPPTSETPDDQNNNFDNDTSNSDSEDPSDDSFQVDPEADARRHIRKTKKWLPQKEATLREFVEEKAKTVRSPRFRDNFDARYTEAVKAVKEAKDRLNRYQAILQRCEEQRETSKDTESDIKQREALEDTEDEDSKNDE